MSLRNVGTGTLSNTPVHPVVKEMEKTRPYKHVELMNLTAIKRVVDVTETQTENEGIFALVCRTNQVIKNFQFLTKTLYFSLNIFLLPTLAFKKIVADSRW